MRLSIICIKRPILATVLSLALVVFGLIGYHYLDLRYFPKVDAPIAQISVSYPGASPDVMEQDVTRLIENSLVNIDGLQTMTSDSTYNSMHIYLTFVPGANLVKTMGDVRNAVSSTLSLLPPDAYAPSITSGQVERPVLNIGFLDKNLSPSQIRDYITQNIVPFVQHLPGMGSVGLFGASPYAMRIWLDPQKMAAVSVTVNDVSQMLQANNIDFSGGAIQGRSRNFAIVANTKIRSVEAFSNLIVKQNNSQVVRLKDVATVALGSQSLQDSPMRINGSPAIDMELRPLNTANPIVVAREAQMALSQFHLPPGMQMVVTYDQSEFLKSAIFESFKTLIEAVILVMLVVYLFLGDFRPALIPIVTIPVCMISVFGCIYLLGFTINVMTLLGLILATGLVVDDAIVVLENIHRHIQEGETPLQAAIHGIKKIAFPVISMTLTLAAVYAPVGFIKGFTAEVFQEFAFTLASAVLISGFVALTLSPMMCAQFLKPATTHTPFAQRIESLSLKITEFYQKRLNQALANYRSIVIFLGLFGALGYVTYLFIPQTFIPKEDIGYFTADINSPPGASIQYTDDYMRQMDTVYAQTPEILSNAAFIFAGTGNNFVTLKPWKQRPRSTELVVNELREKFKALPSALVDLKIPNPVDYGNGTDDNDIQVHIMSFGSYENLQITIDRLKKILSHYPGLTDVAANLKFDNQVYEMQFKRDAAAILSVNLQDIANTVSTMLSGKHITDFQQNNQSYEVRVQMKLSDLNTFSSLNNIYVRSSNIDPVAQAGLMVPLSNLVSLQPGVRQSHLYHTNRMRSADLTANLSPGYSLSKVVSDLNLILKENLSPDEHAEYDGVVAAFLDSHSTMLSLFLLSLVFIYLVLAAQFESFVDPFIILLSVPLCIVGALITLTLTGGSLNFYTNIGLITLVGLITKHGILITQFANDRLKSGDTLRDAVIRAASIRLRPILMTTMAMVLGAIPLAMATGPGSVSHAQIGWVIVGGMLFGTFFSLIVVPMAYYGLAGLDHRKKELLIKQGVGSLPSTSGA